MMLRKRWWNIRRQADRQVQEWQESSRGSRAASFTYIIQMISAESRYWVPVTVGPNHYRLNIRVCWSWYPKGDSPGVEICISFYLSLSLFYYLSLRFFSLSFFSFFLSIQVWSSLASEGIGDTYIWMHLREVSRVRPAHRGKRRG